MTILSLVLVVTTSVLVVGPVRAKAEPFVDLGVGGAFTQNANFKDQGTRAKFEFKDSFSVSARGGYWLEGLPWVGAALSVSYFQPDTKRLGQPPAEDADLAVIPISLLVMVRDPNPNGHFQPYLGLGPSVFIADLSSPKGSGVSGDTAVEPGLDFRAGAAYRLLPHLALFLEYAFSYAEPTFTVTDKTSNASDKVDTTLKTHHVLAGMRVPF